LNTARSRSALFVAAALFATLSGAIALPARAFAASPACTPIIGTPAASGSPVPIATIAPAPTTAPEVSAPGDIPDTQAFVTYQSTAGGYSIVMPEGWARKENGPNVDFADPSHEFSVQIDCATLAPTIESVKATGMAALAQSIEGFTFVDVSTLQLPSGPAIKIRYQANSKPDDVTGKQHRLDVERYEIFKDGRVAVITLAVPAGSDNVDVSNQISTSFQWTA